MAPAREIIGFPSFVGGRWLELLSDIAGLKRAAIMFNPDTAPASAYMPSLETAARPLKVVPITAPVHSDVRIEAAIMALGREPGGGLERPGRFLRGLGPRLRMKDILKTSSAEEENILGNVSAP
jgi:hypothetical protein